MSVVRYDPYTDTFVYNTGKETTATATINLKGLPTYAVQHIVEVSDESIEKIADAVVRKLADRKTERRASDD